VLTKRTMKKAMASRIAAPPQGHLRPLGPCGKLLGGLHHPCVRLRTLPDHLHEVNDDPRLYAHGYLLPTNVRFQRHIEVGPCVGDASMSTKIRMVDVPFVRMVLTPDAEILESAVTVTSGTFGFPDFTTNRKRGEPA